MTSTPTGLGSSSHSSLKHHWLFHSQFQPPKALLPLPPDSYPEDAYYRSGYTEDALSEATLKPLTREDLFHVVSPPHGGHHGHAKPLVSTHANAMKHPAFVSHEAQASPVKEEVSTPLMPPSATQKYPANSEAQGVSSSQEVPHLKSGGVNIRKLVPIVGVGASLAWGVGNIAEHMLHDGHVKFFSKGITGKALLKLAQWLPVINVGYGAINATGAILNGYALRSLAFTAFSAISLLSAPKLLKGNQLFTTLLQKAQKEGFHEVSEAVKHPKFHAWFKKTFTEEALNLKKFSALFNSTVPIGVLMGVFTLTKAAQSLQGVKLLHPHGDTLQELSDPHNPVPVGKALVHNAKQELKAFGNIMTHLPKNTIESLKAFKKGLTRLGQQDTSTPVSHTSSQDAAGKSQPKGLGKLWCDFATPVFNSPFTATTYAITGLGRMISAAFAVSLASQGATHLLTKGNVMNQLAKHPPVTTPQAQKLMGGIGTFFLAGQLAGAISAVFTRFNDWNPTLSAVYRISAIPYALSGFSAINRSFKPLGLGAEDMAKFGAFIQATSYLMNLVLKDQPAKPSTNHTSPSAEEATEQPMQKASS
ncbi:MAG: hypothetical protein ACKO37_05155 [Vampirovibrionales bacterium]